MLGGPCTGYNILGIPLIINSWLVGSNSLANPLAAYLPKSNGIPQMISKEEEIRHSTARNPTENAKDKNHICLLLHNFKISITVSPKLLLSSSPSSKKMSLV